MYFQVNITPENKRPAIMPKEEQQQPAVLILAPFQPHVQLILEAGLHNTVISYLNLKNISNRSLKVKVNKFPPEERGIVLDTCELYVDTTGEKIVPISWTPTQPGTWRDNLQFIDNRGRKYDVSILTICAAKNKNTANGKSKSTTQSKTFQIYPQEVTHKLNIMDNDKTKTVDENKENASNLNNGNRQLNYTSTIENLSHYHQNARNAQEKIGLNISDIQLTPLRPHTSSNILNIMSDINVISATPREFTIKSSTNIGVDDQEVNSRRATYTNNSPKFCKLVLNDDAKEAEDKDVSGEQFDDSLSPSHTKKDLENFSTVINSLNFSTPAKVPSLPVACSTVHRQHEDLAAFLNDTFNVSGTSVLIDDAANNSHELCRTPVATDTCKNGMYPPLNNIEKKLLFNDELARSLTPAPVDQTSSSILSLSLHRRDNASVKEVLEANLWAQDTHGEFRSKATSLEIITEENLDISNRTYTKSPTEMQVCTLPGLSFTKESLQIEISPPRQAHSRFGAIKKPSPIKHNKITKDKSTLEPITLSKKKVQLLANMNKRRDVQIPGVRVAKLSLASLKNKSQNKIKSETSAEEHIIKLNEGNDLMFQICNPDLFAPAITDNPFISRSHLFDEYFMHKQEMVYTKWLNALLTPPELLNVDIESACIDVGKVWQSCKSKDMTLAESKETVSARYHTNTRLNTLRKAACAMFLRDEVAKALGHATRCVEKGVFVIRQDRDLHRDIGLQKEMMELFLSHNPLWLRIGLEVVYGTTIPLHSNDDLIGLTRFLQKRFFSDPYLAEQYAVPNSSTLKYSGFQGQLNKLILTKFLYLIYFLDYAKRNKLIGHDPCLFYKKAQYKESREILITFSRLVLSGIGDITKVLRTGNYIVSHKQTHLEEYDYAVNNLSADLRDGVRLCRIMELITADSALTQRCRLPAISRLQKIHNVEIALTSLKTAGFNIAGDITAKCISDGHREKTLSLLWQLIYKFQAPKYEKAAVTIQKWWRSRALLIHVKRFLINRKVHAACVIQRSWRSFKAREKLVKLREEHKLRQEKLAIAVKMIESRRKMVIDRRRFLKLRSSAITIQRWFKVVVKSRLYQQQLQRKSNAAIVLQHHWRATLAMRHDRNDFLQLKQATIFIQNYWRARQQMLADRANYCRLRSAAIIIQTHWRAKKLMQTQHAQYLEIREATMVIQLWWRNTLIARAARNNYLLQKDAVRKIESFWQARKHGECERSQFLHIKSQVIKIQRSWRRYAATKQPIAQFKSIQSATLVIQTWWRKVRAVRSYEKQRTSAIIIQQQWRSFITMKKLRCEYVQLRQAAIVIQKNWKMKKARRAYQQMKAAVLTIEVGYQNFKVCRSIRTDFIVKKRSAILIQSWWRAQVLGSAVRHKYLQQRSAAMLIQQKYRAMIAGKNQRMKYLALIQATVKIQRTWRANKLMKESRQHYLTCRSAAITIQSWWRRLRQRRMEQHAASIIQRTWRSFMVLRRTRTEYLKLRNAAIVIQRRWRLIVKNRQEAREMQAKLRMIDAAMLIQSYWRGYAVRKDQCEKIEAIRNRLQRAAANAVPSETIESRLKQAINLFQEFTTVGQLSMCLAHIQTITELSPTACVIFCEVNLVERLYQIYQISNRSRPWFEVCLQLTNILITLIKLPATASYVKRIDDTEIIARFMTATIKNETKLFLHLATLFWLYLLDDDFAQEISVHERTMFLIKSLYKMPILKNSSNLSGSSKNKNVTQPIIMLPNTKPDFGMNCKRSKCFTNIIDALEAIKASLSFTI